MKKKLKVCLSMLLILLLTLSLSVTVLAEERDLTQMENDQFESAVQFLRDSEETETADILDALMEDGKIHVADPENGEEASVSSDGSMYISPSQLAALPENASDFMRWKKSLDLAQMLFHEAVHVRQAPDSEYFDPESRRREDWVEVGVVMQICTGPNALEVEAYLKEIKLKTKWYKQISEQMTALESEAPEEMMADLVRKKNYIEEQIMNWSEILKRHNYEKGDYLDDFINELMDEFLSDDETVDRIADELEERIGGLYAEGGPYERAREAYRNRENLESEDSNASDGKTIPHGDDSGITVTPHSPDSASKITTQIAYDNPKPKPGYKYPSGYTPGITATGTTDGIGSGWDIGFPCISDNPVGYVYALGLKYPNEWASLQSVRLQNYINVTVARPAYLALMVKDPSYNDVPADSEYYDIIEYLLDKEIMLGMGGGNFGYGSPLTRAQFATLLVRALKYDIVTTHPFTDVPETKWYHDYVATAYHKDLIQGMGNNLFMPENHISREQSYTIIIRALGLEEEALLLTKEEIDAALSVYTDQAAISAWARPYIAYTLITSLHKVDNSYFGADEIVTREEAASFLYDTINRIYPLR